MTFTFILLLAPQTLFPALGSFRIAFVAAGVAIGTYLVDRFRRRQPITRFTRETWIAAVLVGWAILTVPLSYWPGGSASVLFGLYLKTVATFWLLSNVVNTRRRLRQVVWGLSLMAVPLAAAGVKNYLTGEFLPWGAVKRIVGYDAAMTANPNDLALMLNLILPLTVALFLVNPRPLVRVVLLAVILLDVTAIIVTFSRAGFVTLAMTFGMYVWKLSRRPQRHWALAAILLVFALIPFLPSGYMERLATITNMDADRTGSSQERWRDTVSAVRVVLRSPIIGVGAGMNALALNEERGAYWAVIHNAYLEYAVDLGIPGLVLFVSLLVSCIKSAQAVQRRSARRSEFQEVFHLAEGIQTTLFAFAVAALFAPVGYHFYFYYIAGLAVAVRAVHEAEETHAALDQNPSSRR